MEESLTSDYSEGEQLPQVAQARINVLENELTNKTKALESTEKMLADSQKQYKELLQTFRELSSRNQDVINENDYNELKDNFEAANTQIADQVTIIADMKRELEKTQLENEKLRRSISFQNEADRNTKYGNYEESRFQKSIFQLRQAQEDLMDIGTENQQLKCQVTTLKKELKEWIDFAYSEHELISDELHKCFPYPRNDSSQQREALHRIILELIEQRRQTKEKRCLDYEKLERKYVKVKSALNSVQKRCDCVLDSLSDTEMQYRHCKNVTSQPTYNEKVVSNYTSRTKRNENYNYDQEYIRPSYEEERISHTYKFDDGIRKERVKNHRSDLGECVRNIHSLTKRMKEDYRDLFY